jgi:hypothetical protein
MSAKYKADFLAGEESERSFPLCSTGTSPGDRLLCGITAAESLPLVNQSCTWLVLMGCKVSSRIAAGNPRNLISRR